MPVGNGSAGAAFPIAMCVRVRILNVDNSFCHMELNDQSARACGVWIVHNLGTKWKKKKKEEEIPPNAICIVHCGATWCGGAAAARQTTKTHQDISVEWIIMHFRLLCALASERYCICVHTSLSRNGRLRANGDSFVCNATNNQPIYQTNETKQKINFN